jgi:hypothetical protein
MGYTATHRQQVEERKAVQDAVASVHEMYDCLGHYGQKVPRPDQVKHEDLQVALQEFLQELGQVGLGPAVCRLLSGCVMIAPGVSRCLQELGQVGLGASGVGRRWGWDIACTLMGLISGLPSHICRTTHQQMNTCQTTCPLPATDPPPLRRS